MRSGLRQGGVSLSLALLMLGSLAGAAAQGLDAAPSIADDPAGLPPLSRPASPVTPPAVVAPAPAVTPAAPVVVPAAPVPDAPVSEASEAGSKSNLGPAVSRRSGSGGTGTNIYAALADAYDRNPTLNAQRAATRAADESLAIAKSGYRPQVFADVSVGFNRAITRAGGVTQGSTQLPLQYGVRISQSLFQGFQVVNSVNQAEAQIRGARAQLAVVEQDVLLNAAAAYIDIAFFQELVRVRRADTSFLREQVRSAQARLEVGEGTRTDVAETRARLSLARSAITTAEAQLAAARATFRQAVGRPASNVSFPPVPRRLIPNAVAQVTAVALSRNPAIRGSEHLIDAQAFAVKVEEGALLPSLSANVEAGETRDFGEADTRSTSVTGTLRLSIPLYQGGAASARVRQAKESLGERRIILDQTRDQVRVQAVSAFASYSAAEQVVVSSRQQVAAARLALSGVIEERNVGQRTQLDVLQAQATVLSAQEGLAGAFRDRATSAFQVLASMGRLTARGLRLRVDAYDPRDHYAQVADPWFGLRTPDGR